MKTNEDKLDKGRIKTGNCFPALIRPLHFFISLVGTKAGNAYLRTTFFTVPSVILRMFKPFCRPSVRIPSTR